MAVHDEATLPKWAQRVIGGLRTELTDERMARARVEQAHAVLAERRWFTIKGPPEMGRDGGTSHWPDVYHLWFLGLDQPHPACQLGRGDVLLVGRKREAE